MTKRDDFSKPTIRELGMRVNYHCSKPDCWKSTLGPHSDPEKSVNLGKAAHITAAALGGPRYDKTLSPAERKAISNGIWMCGLHAELVDKDEKEFPVELLRKWKTEAEERARIEAFSTQAVPRGKVVIELDEEDKEFFRNLALPAEETTETILPRMIAAAEKSIETFINDREWPGYVIPLNLTLDGAAENVSITLDGLRQGVEVSEAVNVVSAPGTGKTTTLIQLAQSLLSAKEAAVAYIPLGEWAGQGSWFEFLIRRNAYRSFKPEHFMRMAYEGRLVLLLDGWNELNAANSLQAHNELKGLKREYPQLGIVIGTRQQARPIDGATVRIEGLNREQQLELARQLRGTDGEALIDQAWRNPGVRDLISIPLYLIALLSSAAGTTFPQTKEAILNNFVARHETDPKKAEILRTQLLGFHKEILISLATAANNTASTNLPDDIARSAVSEAIAALVARQQLAPGLQPTTVLDVLVDMHLLARLSSDGKVSFQHHQFQEWYAAFTVEQLMLDAAQGSTEAKNKLRTDVLNWISWEESILFACERLSRKDDAGKKAVAATILETLGIDPMLAAEMIYRSAPEIWSQISHKVLAFGQRWHQPGKVDRAYRFMITTGRSEFAGQVWSLIENPDNQVYLKALRASDRFRPSVLGPDAAKRLAALPDEQRGHVVAEIAHHSGYDGMELAAKIAEADKSPNVVFETLQSLQFRQSVRHVKDILRSASDAVWQKLAQSGHFEKFSDKEQAARYAELRRAEIENERDHIKLINLLLHSDVEGIDAEKRIFQVLIAADYPEKNDHARSIIYEVHKKYPTMTTSALMQRLADGREVPYGVDEMLENAPLVDEGPIVDAVLNKTTHERIARVASKLIGPVTVGKLIDEFLDFGDKIRGQPHNKGASKEYYRLRDAILTSPQSSFLQALFERAETDEPQRIATLAELLFLHGKDTEQKLMTLSEDEQNRLTVVLVNWSKALLATDKSNRHQISEVMQAIRRLPLPQFVPLVYQMLERDITDRTRAREEWIKSGRGHQGPDVCMCYHTQYRFTFSAIGDAGVIDLMKKYLPDMRFGFEAACVLLDIWNRDHPFGKERRVGGWYDYSDVKERRARMEVADKPSSSEGAEAIFEVARNLGKPEKSKEEQHHALKLAKIGLAMPYGVQRAETQLLMNLPQPYAAKQDLFLAMAISGAVIPADKLIEAFHELMEDGKKEPWRLEENRGGLMTWVELFAFSDRPLAVMEIIDLLPNHHRQFLQLRRLISALGYSPHPNALSVLKALAQRDVNIAQDHEWIDALIRVGTEEAAHVLLDLICNGTIKGERGGLGIWRLSQQLGSFSAQYATVRTEMLRRYQGIGKSEAKAIVEGALIEVADVEIVLAIMNQMATNGEKYDQRLARAISKLAIGERKSAEWTNAFERYSKSQAEFRKQLFAMLPGGNALSELAEQCLNEIERLRDEYGRIDNEPRHPDIFSGRAWPKEAEESETASSESLKTNPHLKKQA